MLEMFCSIGFSAPGNALGSGGMGGMGRKKGGMMGGMNASTTDLASLA